MLTEKTNYISFIKKHEINELISMCSHEIENVKKLSSLGYLLTIECHGKIKYLMYANIICIVQGLFYV